MFIVADFDHSVPEYDTKVQDAHYVSKIETHQMNIVCEPGGRHTYLWSEKEAGKKSTEFMSVLKYHWEERSVGAGKQTLAMDGANTNVNQNFFKWCHWISCECNPNRLFTSLEIALYHRGHSWNPADSVGNQKQCNCKHCDVIRNTKHRVDFLNSRNISCKATQLKDEFFDFPENFDEIYLALSKWKDDKGQKFLIRDDKPIVLHFQESEVWDVENKQWKTVQHPNEIYVRQSWDFKVAPRIVPIVKKDFDSKTFDFSLIQYKQSKKPKVKQNKIDGTMKLVELAQDTEMIKYYAGFNNIDKTPTIDKDRKPTSPKRFQTQMERLMILDSNQKENKKDPLPKFEKRKTTKKATTKTTNKGKKRGVKRKRSDNKSDNSNNTSNEKDKNKNENDNINGSNDNNDGDGAPAQKKTKLKACKVEIKLKKKDLNSYKMKSLKNELSRHGLDGKARRKDVLVQRLENHIRDCHRSGPESDEN